MKSISYKLILLILCCVLSTAVIVGGTSAYHASRLVDNDSQSIMKATCENSANQINTVLQSIEQSVNLITEYAQIRVEGTDSFLADETYADDYTAAMEEILKITPEYTKKIKSYYLRFNPEIADSTAGLFYVRDAVTGTFVKSTPTDLYSYEKDDVEHVGWYYIPVRNGTGTWISPYHNDNINSDMISYVVPIRKQGETIGVLGMDIDLETLRELIQDSDSYENDGLILTDKNQQIIYETRKPTEEMLTLLPEVVKETQNRSKVIRTENGNEDVVFEILENGMYLFYTMSETERRVNTRMLALHVAGMVVVIAAFFIFLSFLFIKRIVWPLKKLSDAARQIAKGNMDVEIQCDSKDETGVLAESIRYMQLELRCRMDYMHDLAYIDSLTGMRNRNAYTEKKEQLQRKISLHMGNFVLILFDINNLKEVNDRKGHEQGDLLLQTTAEIIGQCFHSSNVYRIGGDEFAVILEQTEVETVEQILQEMDAGIAEKNRCDSRQKVSFARGVAAQTGQDSQSYSQIFQLADRRLYENKKKMKSIENGVQHGKERENHTECAEKKDFDCRGQSD